MAKQTYSIYRPVINDAQQALLVSNNGADKPLLLILHGGPGEPVTPFLDGLKPIEERFRVCIWEQRGAGMSYSAGSKDTMHIRQFVADTVAVTEAVLAQCKRDKLTLMGFSWGTLIGLLAAAKAPSFYNAYIGVGQLADQKASEKAAYDEALTKSKAAGDTKSQGFLEKHGAPPYSGKDSMKLMMKERGILRKYSDNPAKSPNLVKYFAKIFTCPYYSFSDKMNYIRGMMAGASLFPEVLETRVSDMVQSVSVPVYIMQGRFDMQTRPEFARELAEGITAPHKEYVQFEKSGHSPFDDEPELFLKKLDEIVIRHLS